MSVFANPLSSKTWQSIPTGTAPQPDHYYACQCGECAAAFVNIRVKTNDPSTATATVSAESTAQASALPYYVSALLYPQDWRWNADYKHGTAITVTYSFMTSNPGTYGGFRAFTEAEKAAARRALDEWAEICNVTFQEVTNGQIKFGNADLGGASGMALWKGTAGKYSGVKTTSSEVYLNSKMGLTYEDGSFGYRAMLHEIGHALGLKHSFDTVGTTLSGIENTGQYTVMSYANPPSTPQVQPHTAQAYDIAAVQHLYGANTKTNAGDTVHQISNSKTQVQTIWDGGGIDTIDASNQSRAAAIDLREGAFSSIGTYNGGAATDNVAIAFGTVIERAIGGSGNDRIVGNAAANVIIGAMGADILTGGAGADIFAWRSASEGGDTVTDFTSGADRLEFLASGFGLAAGILDTARFVKLNTAYTGTNGSGSEWSGGKPTFIFDSTGTLYWDANGSGSGHTRMATLQTGTISASDIHLVSQVSGPGSVTAPQPQPQPEPEPAPVVTTDRGTTGDDVLDGRGGEKTLVGGTGHDVYIVDSAGDQVVEYGGQGVDTVHSSIGWRLGSYTENLVLTGSGDIDGIGSSWHNRMTGNDGDNVLRGLGGNDVIDGKGGSDILVGGAGRDALTGGAGRDLFLFERTGDIAWKSTNGTKDTLKSDTIADFTPGEDHIAFLASGFALTKGGAVDGANFARIGNAYDGANAYGTAWNSGKASLVFDSTGTLYYDPNGKGGGYHVVAQLQPGANVHASDIVIA